MTELTFKAKDFEGPLDLLLALAAKNKMSLFDIDLIALIDQYLEIIKDMQSGRLEVASEFIDMASRLVLLKSVHLLPRSQEAEKIKQELTGRLVEYALCKNVAQKLRCMSEGRFYAVREPMTVPFDTTYSNQHDITLLIAAYNSAYDRKRSIRMPTQEQFEPLVAKPMVSVNTRIDFLRLTLKNGRCRLSDVFNSQDKSCNVATFLAILELLHSNSLAVEEGMYIRLTDEKGADIEAI